MRRLVYYVATSLDGFIAAPDGDFSFFAQDPATLAALFERYPETCPVQAREALGVSAANRRFDTVLMGYRTHEPALALGLAGGAYPHLRQVVATHRDLGGAVETMTGDLAARVAELKQEDGADIWLCGGASLAGALAAHIDELQLKVNPVQLGRGIPLFTGLDEPVVRTLVGSETLPGGVLLNTYR